MNVPTNPAVRFFYEHAGYARSPGETIEAAKWGTATALADAEARASRAGVSFAWEVDPFTTSADWIAGRQDGGKYRNPWSTWSVVLRAPDGTVLDSLGGVDFGRDGEPWGDPYRRVCEAEMALEALDQLAALEVAA